MTNEKVSRGGGWNCDRDRATQLFLRRALRTCTLRIVNTWRYARVDDKLGIQPRKFENNRATLSFLFFSVKNSILHLELLDKYLSLVFSDLYEM